MQSVIGKPARFMIVALIAALVLWVGIGTPAWPAQSAGAVEHVSAGEAHQACASEVALRGDCKHASRAGLQPESSCTSPSCAAVATISDGPAQRLEPRTLSNRPGKDEFRRRALHLRLDRPPKSTL